MINKGKSNMSRASWTSLLGASFVAAGCAGAPPTSLVDARAAYQRAAEGDAQQLAPDQLHAAEVFLKTAERTYDDEGDTPALRDRAYVAMRKAQLAEAHAGIVNANMEVKRAQQQQRADERTAHVAVSNELVATRAELANSQGLNATQNERLQAETQRREQAEAAQQEALAALERAGEVKQESRGTVITLSGAVVFASGQSALLPSARNKLSEVATALSTGDGGSKIVIEGHTDSTGSEETNRELSLKRATAVRDELIAQGVSSDRVSVEGFGASRPIADNSTQAGRANNRRVEIVIEPVT
jgi:outer membrane protein OmpA-like peptidoglycan-associated protein